MLKEFFWENIIIIYKVKKTDPAAPAEQMIKLL